MALLLDSVSLPCGFFGAPQLRIKNSSVPPKHLLLLVGLWTQKKMVSLREIAQ